MKTYEMVRKEDVTQAILDNNERQMVIISRLKKEKRQLADQLYKWTGFAQLFVKGTEFTITKDTLDMLENMGYQPKAKKGE
jgi:glutaredoxin-related protein